MSKKNQTRVVRFTKDEDRMDAMPLVDCKSLPDLTKRLHSEAKRMKAMAGEMPFISIIERRRLTGEASAYLRVAEMIRKLEVSKILDRAGRTIAYRHTKIEMPSGVTHILEIANNLAQSATD